MTQDKYAEAKEQMAAAQEAATADNERFAEIAKLKENAVTWKPTEAGDEVWGTLIDGAWVYTSHGSTRVMTLQDGDDIHTVWCGTTRLASEMDKQQPQIGSIVGVKYGGVQEPVKPGGRQWKEFFMQATGSDPKYWQQSYESMMARKRKKDLEQQEQQATYAAPTSDPLGNEMEAPY